MAWPTTSTTCSLPFSDIVELLLLDTPLDDPRRTDILEIEKAGMSAAGLTRQLLDYSRKQIIAPTLLDANRRGARDADHAEAPDR